MPPTGPPWPEYDMKPYYGPGFRPAVGLEGPSDKAIASRPKACGGEELERGAAVGLINHCVMKLCT